ncbi:MAG: helix-turn-helix domain-containing protein [Pseudomonadota bacterium]|nr:helix-turn-helix domain-containing protein [Pseudomonadota bacterium]
MSAKKLNVSRNFNTVELGAMLCEVRENLGHNLENVAQELKIRLDYLQAIESGQLSDLPSNVYASGFTRTYAEYLGLEGDEIVRQFKAAGVTISDRTNLNLPSPVEEGRLPTAKILLLGGLIAVGAYGGWYLFSAQGWDPTRGVSKLPNEMSVLIEKTKNGVERKFDRPRTPEAMPVLKSVGSPSSAPGLLLKGKDQPPARAETNIPGPGSVPSQTPLIASAQTQTTVALPNAPGVIQKTLSPFTVVHAIADSYVYVRCADILLFSGLLRRGAVYKAPSCLELTLSTGNAGGLQISSGEKVSAPLGLSGEVRRNIPLNGVKLFRRQD